MPASILNLAFFQGLVLLSFVGGMLARRRAGPQADLNRTLVRINLIVFEPVIVFWATWGLAPDPAQLILPLGGLIFVLWGFACAAAFARVFFSRGALQLGPLRRPVYLISGSLGNHGFTLCGTLAFLWLGENGLGLAAIFTLYFTPYVFLFIFPYAESAASASADGASRRTPIWRQWLSWNYLPLYATLLALALVFGGVPRPDWQLPVHWLLVPTVSLYYLTLGLSFNSRSWLLNWPTIFSFAAIKFALIPAICGLFLLALKLLFAYELAADYEALLWIMAFAPAATYSVVASVLYRLDEDFAAELFVTNVGVFLIGVLPVLAWWWA